MNVRAIAGACGALALAVTTMVGAPAVANDEDVIREGECSGSSDWKVKASPEDGGIELEGEVDSNKDGQWWRWRMLHNGDLSARGAAKTQPPSGSFERQRYMWDIGGPDVVDTFVFRARQPKTGEVCRGTVQI
jgi:hypothetical protein